MRPHVVILAFDGPQRDRVLAVRHRERGWELPGGALEPGETAGRAAARELAEETGLAPRSLRCIWVRQTPQGPGWAFETILEGAPTPAPRAHDEILEARWIPGLGSVHPLSFPNDPYEQMGAALARPGLLW